MSESKNILCNWNNWYECTKAFVCQSTGKSRTVGEIYEGINGPFYSRDAAEKDNAWDRLRAGHAQYDGYAVYVGTFQKVPVFVAYLFPLERVAMNGMMGGSDPI